MPPDFCKVKTTMEYIIPVKGLALGSSQYTFKIDDSFFSNYEYFGDDTGLLDLVVDLIKESNLIDFRFHFTGTIEATCDRCLDRFTMKVENSFRLIVNYGLNYEEVSDEVITIPSSESNIDISQFIYEYVNLMFPIKRVHPMDEDGNSTCNKDMTDMLNEYSEQEEDPRWDALKKLKLD